MSVLTYYFGWPDGAVWSNLLASVIWGTPSLTGLYRAHVRHINRQTQQLTQHITDTAMCGTAPQNGEHHS